MGAGPNDFDHLISDVIRPQNGSRESFPRVISPEIFWKVAERLFDELDRDQFQPVVIIKMCEDEEEQREAAELFHTTLPELSTRWERERAFHDIPCWQEEKQLSFLYGKSWDRMSMP